MRRLTFAVGEYYHVFNRGVDKRTIFTSSVEYKRFLAYLLLLNDMRAVRNDSLFRGNNFLAVEKPSEPLVAIAAYCLMPNHFHLYLTPLQDRGISKFMQRLSTAYTMYFNEKHERNGSLLQGTFKAEHVISDRYARYLFSYIHLNPAKMKDRSWKGFGARDFSSVREYVRNYPYSSIGEYLTGKHRIIDPYKFPDYFSKKSDIDEHIDFWLRYSHRDHKEENQGG